MPAEVYSATKPVAPFRAWVVAVFLLLVAGALAGAMVRRTGQGWSAGDLIEPQGWEMIFRPPAQFEEVDPDARSFGTVYVFRHAGPDSRQVEIAYWRLKVSDASWMASRILESSTSWFSLLVGPPRTRTVGRLGGRDALEIHDPGVPMLVRSLVSKSGWGYGVSLRVEGGPLDEGLYRMFEITCLGVRFRSVTP